MLLKADQQRVTALLTETVTLLCKNGLHFKSQFKIEGLIGITLDQEDIFLVNINETVAVEGPAQDDDGGSSPLPVDGRPTSSKKRRQRHTPAETTHGPTSELPSAKPLSALTSKESYTTIHHDNSSTSDHRSRSPAQPASVKSQSEDAGLTRTGSPRPSSSGKASETNASDRVVSFCDVPIKLDYALSSRDPSASASDGRHANEPASKRPRRHVPALDAPLAQEQNSMEPAGFDMPSGSSSYKMEPSDIIEIKEESLSDDEMKESIADYSSYAEYSSATGVSYGGGDLDASQMYGETSGFQGDAMFQGDMQANAGLRSHEGPAADAEAMLDSYGGTLRVSRRTYRKDTEGQSCEKRPRRPYVCPSCGRHLHRLGDLQAHMAVWHNLAEKHKCSYCSKEYAHKKHLKRHMIVKHQFDPNVSLA